LLKFWKPDEITDEMLSMLLNKRCPYFLVGMNLAAHFLDEPSVQKLYEEQDDPKAISQYFLNDL
jgi:hypothetical protein